ncbi:MGMT family protein [Brachybacterium sp. DNPG3]
MPPSPPAQPASSATSAASATASAAAAPEPELEPERRGRTRMDDLTVERVLRTVEAIPPGRVAAYGEIGAVVGVGPRLVGRILRTWGSTIPWWRVTSADGDHPLIERAREHWQAEGIALKPNGRGCRMSAYGADLERLRADVAPALAELDRDADGPDDGLDDRLADGDDDGTASPDGGPA